MKTKFQIWWIPQVPGSAFTVLVDSLIQAKLILDILAKYDIFQFQYHIKPDYSNAGGLTVYEHGEWTDWYNDEGQDIDDLTMEECAKLDEERMAFGNKI